MKMLTMVVSLLVITSMLAACGGNNSGTAEKDSNKGADTSTIKLVMWGGVPPESGPQEVVDNWNAANADIQVEYVRYVNDDDGNLKLDTALLTGQSIDLYVSYTMSNIQKRVDAGVALDLTSRLGEYNIDEKMGPDAKLWQLDGTYYGMPTKKNASFVALNQNALEKANLKIPKEWTWDEYKEYAKILNQDFDYGLVQSTVSFMDPLDSVLENIGYTKADGSSNMDNEYTVKWLEISNEMMTVDKSTPTLGEQLTSKMPVENMFLGGEAAMLSIGEWLIRSSNNLDEYPRDFKIAFAPIPRLLENSEDFITSGGLGDFISVNAKSKNQDAAWKFLQWYADGGMAPMAAGGRLPSSKDMDASVALDNLLGDKANTYDVDSLKYVLFEDTTPTFVRNLAQEVIDLRTQEYEKYFLGGQNAQDAAANMAKHHNKFINK
ncbi:MAG TPA: extracellular solute-binding protein [Candidatus Paenibacillus intestinavium]|nr:extracellular solute-binding protein [Candidatus Paenibacillus intestinavium]